MISLQPPQSSSPATPDKQDSSSLFPSPYRCLIAWLPCAEQSAHTRDADKPTMYSPDTNSVQPGGLDPCTGSHGNLLYALLALVAIPVLLAGGAAVYCVHHHRRKRRKQEAAAPSGGTNNSANSNSAPASGDVQNENRSPRITIRVMDGLPLHTWNTPNLEMSVATQISHMNLPEATPATVPGTPSMPITYMVTTRAWGRRKVRGSEVHPDSLEAVGNPLIFPFAPSMERSTVGVVLPELLTHAGDNSTDRFLSYGSFGQTHSSADMEYGTALYYGAPPFSTPAMLPTTSSRVSEHHTLAFDSNEEEMVMEDLSMSSPLTRSAAVRRAGSVASTEAAV